MAGWTCPNSRVIIWAGDIQADSFFGAHLYTSGNAGIGTTSPAGILHIITPDAASGVTSIMFGTGLASGDQELRIGTSKTSGYSWIQSASKLVTYTNLVLQSLGGNVGIGTTAPESLLNILKTEDNSATAMNVYTGGITIDNQQATAGAYSAIRLKAQANDYVYMKSVRNADNDLDLILGTFISTTGDMKTMTLDPLGNVGIGMTNPTYMLDVNSWIRGVALKVQASGTDANRYSVYWNSVAGDMIFVSSDTKFKKDFDYNISGMETINLLKPLYFSYKDNNFNEAGFLAEEVYNANSNLAWYSAEKEEHGLNGPMGFIAVLVKAVQEQNLVIADLKKRIEILELPKSI